MLTGELRSQIDAIWNAFWSGGISNPMEVLEEISYLLFVRRLDDAHTLEENKALTLGKFIQNRVFPAGKDDKGRESRWSVRAKGSTARSRAPWASSRMPEIPHRRSARSAPWSVSM